MPPRTAMIVAGGDGRIEFVNVQTERLFDYARSELIGQHLDVLIPERFRLAHSGHLSRFFADPGARSDGIGT